MRVLELADKLRARGLQVVEVEGWQTRGREFPLRPDICIRHWTAGPTTGRTPSLRVVTNGRIDLRGPLAQIYQSRETDGDDVIFVIASGVANHAGRGRWAGVSGNSKSMGLEIEWSGPDETFSDRRKLVSELAMAALMDCALGTNTNDACEHREYALPPGRKIDTNLDGDELRRRMAELRDIPDDDDDDDDDPAEHIVAEGDTLASIAAEHELALPALLDLNPQLIEIGDRLKLR